MTEHIFGLQRPVQGQLPTDAFLAKQAFQPLPKPTGSSPLHLDLQNIITAGDYRNTLKRLNSLSPGLVLL